MKPVQVRLPREAYEALASYAHVHNLTLGGAAAALAHDSIMGRAYGLPPAPPRADVAGFVYIIKVGELFKIGKARNVLSRIRSLQTTSEPELIAQEYSEHPLGLERKLHQELSHLCERGEWFRLGAADLERAVALLKVR